MPLTIREAAARLGISPASVRRLIASGELPSARPGPGRRKIVVREADVAARLEATEVAASPAAVPVRRAVRRYQCRYL